MDGGSKSLKRGLRADALGGVVHSKEAPRYVEEFRSVCMNREFVQAVCARYNADGTDLKEILSLAEERAFVRNLDFERTSDVPKEIDE